MYNCIYLLVFAPGYPGSNPDGDRYCPLRALYIWGALIPCEAKKNLGFNLSQMKPGRQLIGLNLIRGLSEKFCPVNPDIEELHKPMHLHIRLR